MCLATQNQGLNPQLEVALCPIEVELDLSSIGQAIPFLQIQFDYQRLISYLPLNINHNIFIIAQKN
jgi:hypothetical protein